MMMMFCSQASSSRTPGKSPTAHCLRPQGTLLSSRPLDAPAEEARKARLGGTRALLFWSQASSSRTPGKSPAAPCPRPQGTLLSSRGRLAPRPKKLERPGWAAQGVDFLVSFALVSGGGPATSSALPRSSAQAGTWSE